VGHPAAIGAAGIPMDSDLQHPPAAIPKMIAKWTGSAKVAIARRCSRNESRGRRYPSYPSWGA